MFWLDFSNTGFKLGNFDFPYFILIAFFIDILFVDVSVASEQTDLSLFTFNCIFEWLPFNMIVVDWLIDCF